MITTTLKTIASLGAALSLTSVTQGANIRFAGPANYELSTKIQYRAQAPAQSGRYKTLGRGYYHSGNIGMRFIDNRSRVNSGTLSFEFWALPFVGATSGPILSTSVLKKRIPAFGSFYDVQRSSYTLYIDRYRFPDINIWEYTRRTGWVFRDSFTFRYRELL